MSLQRMWILGLYLAASLGLATVLCQAADPKKAPEQTAAERDDTVANLALAFELADVGRRASSPEALVAAAKILSKIEGVTNVEGAKPTTGKTDPDAKPKAGDPVKGEGKTGDFAADIKELLETARKFNTSKDPKVTALIDSVATGGRGARGGPKMVNGNLVSGTSDSWTFKFNGGEQARVVITNPNNVKMSLAVFGPRGDKIGEFTGRSTIELFWTPQADNNFVIKVSNIGNATTAYRLVTN
jgi:hypothetical protein